MELIRQLRGYPFLRLLLPLIIGIALGDYLFFHAVLLSGSSLLIVFLALAALLLAAYHSKNYSFRWMFGIILCIFFFGAGVLLSTLKMQHNTYTFPAKPAVYKAVITGNPEQKERSILCPAYLTEGYTSYPFPVKRKVLLYFATDSTVLDIRRGDELLVKAQFSLPRNNGNPDEFDYPRYLVRKGISGTGFVASGQWQAVSRTYPYTIQEYAFDCRDALLTLYRKLGFQDEEFAVLSALTIGYKEELSEDIRESFSISGASHVLALSGLHVGLILAVLLFVFRRLFGDSRLAILLRSIIIVVALWVFAFITGLSPSVVRVVTMFSLITLASISSRKVLTLQSLATAAFFMLLYNPLWLFDVGFQLSYIAVLGIVLLQPRISGLLTVHFRPLRWMWELITVSVSAQIATAPLVIFYFSRFSTHFLLTNLLVIPLVTIIIYGAMVMLALTPFFGLQQLLASALKVLIGWLNGSVRWVEQLPYASVDNIWLYRWNVVAIYLFFLLLLYFIWKRKIKAILFSIGCVSILFAVNWGYRKHNPSETNIAFYNIRNTPAIHCIHSNRASWLVSIDSSFNYKRIGKTMSAYWNRRRLESPQPVTADYSDAHLTFKDNMLSFNGIRIGIVNDNRWYNKYTDAPFKVDYLYVCNGYTRPLEALTSLFTAQCIVLDSSLPVWRQDTFVNECIRLKIPCIALWKQAFIVSFP